MPSHFVKSLVTVDLSKVTPWEVNVLREEFQVTCEDRFATFQIDSDLRFLEGYPRGSLEPLYVLLGKLLERNALSLTLLWEMWSNETFGDDEGWRLEYEAWWTGVCEARGAG